MFQLTPQRILESTKASLEIIGKHGRDIQFSIKPSIDGVGEKHDEIRGVPGNFKKLEETISLLKPLADEYKNFHLELGTVVSKFNVNDLREIEDYVHSAGIESYRNEIAEERTEFHNIGDGITPTPDNYEKLMEQFKKKIRGNISNKKQYAKVTEAFRLTYYDLVTKIISQNTQVIPCFGGVSNVHINFDGEVWPCCVLGYSKPMGNVRDSDFDFQKVWRSQQAKEVRKFIKDKNCACPLANQWYSNILCHFRSMCTVLANYLSFKKPKE